MRERARDERKKMGLAFVVVKCVVALSIFDVIFCILSWNFCTFVKVGRCFTDWTAVEDDFQRLYMEFQKFRNFCTTNYIKCGIWGDFLWIFPRNTSNLICTRINFTFCKFFVIHSSTLRSFLFLFWNFSFTDSHFSHLPIFIDNFACSSSPNLHSSLYLAIANAWRQYFALFHAK